MAGVVKTFLSEPAKHLYKLLRQKNYYTYHRLVSKVGRIPRFVPFKVRVHGWELHLPDSASFLSTYKEIFLNQIYAFEFEGESPRILDLGANVGLSVLFFKQLFPKARVTAFEPDPVIFAYLEQNVHGNGYKDVKLVNKAAWNKNTSLSFCAEGADAGYVAGDGTGEVMEVEAVDIGMYLAEHEFDFLKMDIEGAEKEVLPACRPHLAAIGYIFVEYHSRRGKPQRLAEILSILEEAGFRLSLREVWGSASPLLVRKVNPEGYDFQANIFGFREDEPELPIEAMRAGEGRAP